MRTKIVLTVILLYSITLVIAKNSISGYVTNTKTGNSISNIEVKLNSANFSTLTVKTNNEGFYKFDNLNDGIYFISIKCSNYQSFESKKIVLSENTYYTFNISLLPDEKLSNKKDEYRYSDVKPSVGINAKTSAAYEYSNYSGQTAMYNSYDDSYINYNTETYNYISENRFKKVIDNPLSTFSIDVDKAAYANVRRFLNNSQMPYKDAVRIEEMINYFDYNYQKPKGDDAFSTYLELGTCPWNSRNQLLLIGIQGKNIDEDNLPPNNLVFLIDVSGSMAPENRLPLLKKSFRILIDKLRPQDKVAIVVYAGAAGLVLPSTPGNEKEKIISAIDKLNAGGSTAGGEGIRLAYKIAEENFIPNANNRIILASDGDFNVGISSTSELERFIESKRDLGVYLTILGFGIGNYKDSRFETLSNKGNGNYFYIDNILEAKKVFDHELWGTLFTIANDVKIQIEFNPAKVKEYRLIGYENRLLNKEDFNNDKKDAGDIGCGHSVTALFELVPTDGVSRDSDVDQLNYQTIQIKNSSDLMTLKIRYKTPGEKTSKLITSKIAEKDIKTKDFSDKFLFASAVAEFGMLLRDSEFKGSSTYDSVLELANKANLKDNYGYIHEFKDLVEKAKLLSKYEKHSTN
jgi:Ca-activated chloride channel family protein